MTSPDTGGLIQAIGGLVTAGAGAALVIGKMVQMQRTGRTETFRESMKALQDENARCWAEVDRLRVERNEKDAETDELELRLQTRRDEVHRLNNLLSSYVLRFGHIEPEPDENGGPT